MFGKPQVGTVRREFLVRDFFARSLVRKLALAIVGLTLAITFVQGTLSYLEARRALQAEVVGRLESIRHSKRLQILDYLSMAGIRTSLLARGPEVATALQRLLGPSRVCATGAARTLETSSDAYKAIHGELVPLFKDRLLSQVCDGIVLLCAEHGHVLFSLDDGDALASLGINAVKSGGLARLCKKVVRSAKVAVEDFDCLDKESPRPVMLFGAPVLDERQRVVAVLVEQFTSRGLDQMMHKDMELGAMGEIVLVGEDKLLRARLRLSPGEAILSLRIDTTATREALAGRTGTGVMIDYRGIEVLAAYQLLGLRQAAGVDFDWAIVVKQTTAEAFGPSDLVRQKALGVALGALLLALTVGVTLARSLTGNVLGMVRVADRIAGGDLDSPIPISGCDEIGRLGESLQRMQSSLRQMRERNRQTGEELRKVGDYTRNLIESSIDPLVTIGPDGKITDVNRASEEATGIPRAQLVGTDFADYFTEPEKAQAGYRQVFKDGVVRDYPLELLHRGGRVMPVLYNAAVYKDEAGKVVGVFAAARDVTEARRADWIKTGLARLNDAMRGEDDVARLANTVLTELCTTVGAQVGVLYVTQDEGADAGTLSLLASYAHTQRKGVANRFRTGEGLVGQAALERKQIVISQVPDDYVRVVSGLGETPPRQLCVTPLMFEEQVRGVAELGTLGELDAARLEYLSQAAHGIGVAFETALGRARLSRELERSRAMAEKLQAQQEELKASNEELQQQADALTHSEQKLQTQQEELRVSNEELEEKNELLERQTREVEAARRALGEKAEEVALASKSKSEFLANMSHELRTPLNSLLILAKMLADNVEGNLSGKQVQYARTILDSGSDLLEQINDVLDLSKVESGTMDVNVSEVPFDEVNAFVERTFRQVADSKELEFEFVLEPGLPRAMRTDGRRLQQILRNLLSNAFKFTEEGKVALGIHRGRGGWSRDNASLESAEEVVAFAVSDTGIGIPKEKHALIFGAFQQADGTTSRRFGGTGLGLSISRELGWLLGGEITLQSEPGAGSTFTLFLPMAFPERSAQSPTRPTDASLAGGKRLPRAGQAGSSAGETMPPEVSGDDLQSFPVEWPRLEDDRACLAPGDRVVLIVEDDRAFAEILLELARERGFKGVVATTADQAIALSRNVKPAGITLDLRLPDKSGWSVLDLLKHDPATRHIPVHIISVEEERMRGLRQGALSFLQKPVTRPALAAAFAEIQEFLERPLRRLLVVEDNEVQRKAIVELVGNGDVQTTAVGTAGAALDALRGERFDCMVLDLKLPDMAGAELMARMQREPDLRHVPIVVYTGKELTEKEEVDLRRHASAIVVKGVHSPERLLEETALFLHRVESRLPAPKREMLDRARQLDSTLAGKKVLVVDDDMRNIFALVGVLEAHQLLTAYAENGRVAIELLQKTPDVDAVLMDIMMPIMDGYETIRAIRELAPFRRLPIIALTAKAMKGDREKCIEAGASDYIPKPVEVERLLSLLRVWLYR